MVERIVRVSKPETFYMRPWKTLEVTGINVDCKVERYQDPSKTLETVRLKRTRKFGPYGNGQGFRVSVVSGDCTVKISDETNSPIDTDDGAEKEPILPCNKLINVLPTFLRAPYSASDAALYTNATGGAVADTVIADPTTGLAMARITINSGSSSAQLVEYANMSSALWVRPDDNDVYLLSIYSSEQIDDLNVEIITSDQTSVIGGEFRKITMNNRTVPKGYSLLPVLSNEVKIDSNTFGEVGTHYNHEWVDGNSQDKNSVVKTVRVQVKIDPGPASNTSVHIGAIFTAPAGWAKAAVMWYSDDVQSSFLDLAGPVIESYGWNYTVAAVSNYASLTGPSHTNIKELREAVNRGHELHAHTRAHENVPTLDTAGKTRALKSASDYWNANGMQLAGQIMAWPFGQFDDESITIAKSLGLKVGFSTLGDEISPLVPTLNPMNMHRLSVESMTNPWQVDSMINGSILRGSGIVAYMHGIQEGGEGINAHAGATTVYLDHFKRWCELIAKHEADGRCVVTTPSRYFKLCGVDPLTGSFTG